MSDTKDPAHDPAQEPVATGDRRDVHYEPDPDQLLVARSTIRPSAPLPPEEQSFASQRGSPPPGPPIEDVRIAPDGPSAWDARPPADDDAKSGEPTGH